MNFKPYNTDRSLAQRGKDLLKRLLRRAIARTWSHAELQQHPARAQRLWGLCGCVIFQRLQSYDIGMTTSRVYKDFEHGWVRAYTFTPSTYPQLTGFPSNTTSR